MKIVETATVAPVSIVTPPSVPSSTASLWKPDVLAEPAFLPDTITLTPSPWRLKNARNPPFTPTPTSEGEKRSFSPF
ncbi:capsular polysaccharide biosynthesis protein [Anopheles sinensis]|uniref:Capsular polysaccharide biosynthesis protein n=1 Tax=Anopheles sinensis TaxID=74873 RepID=A0A084VAT2_ANOSI|nr:capsular polysaccharide biosynthesis protein [Anopheles sinensis]